VAVSEATTRCFSFNRNKCQDSWYQSVAPHVSSKDYSIERVVAVAAAAVVFSSSSSQVKSHNHSVHSQQATLACERARVPSCSSSSGSSSKQVINILTQQT
jgi:hypothetical protein